MRDLLYLRMGQYEPTKAYISTTKLEKCTATTHVDLNKTYTRGNNENAIKRFQAMCLFMSDNYEQQSEI